MATQEDEILKRNVSDPNAPGYQNDPWGFIRGRQNQIKSQRDATAKKNQEFQAQAALAQQTAHPGEVISAQTDYEKNAGVAAPNYQGTRDVNTGELLDQYKLNPYSGEAQQALKAQAFATGDSPWAKMQLQQQQMEQMGANDQLAKQSQQAVDTARSGLARFGGATSGSARSLARQGIRSQLQGGQDIARQGSMARLGIGQEDLDRKQGLLTNFANAEGAAQTGNIGTLTNDIGNKAKFDISRYQEQLRAYGAQKSGEAQAAAAGGGGKK